MVVAEMKRWGLPPALILVVLLLVHNDKFGNLPQDIVGSILRTHQTCTVPAVLDAELNCIWTLWSCRTEILLKYLVALVG